MIQIDPTANVIATLKAAVERLDDLRALNNKRLAEGMKHTRVMVKNNAAHQKELRILEADRLDKIRQVDVSNAAATAAQLLSAVQTLASTAQATAETLRNQVAATAAAVASQTERVVNPIIERIALLEKSSYTGQGKQAVSDPAMADLVGEMRKLTAAGSESAGKQAGLSQGAAILLSTLAGIASLLAIAGWIFALVKH